MFTALDIRATMFSRGRVVVLDEKGEEVDDDPFLTLIQNPNFSQSQQDFLYKHEFLKCLGTLYTRAIPRTTNGDATNIDNIVSLEHLSPSGIDYNGVNEINQMRFSPTDKKNLLKRKIKYTISDTVYEIPLSELLMFYDVTNGLKDDTTFVSPSRISALAPEISNIQEAQKSKNINLKFSGKWFVSNKNSFQGVAKPLQEGERKIIEKKVYHKDILATNGDINAKSLAGNFRQLLFDDSISSDATKVFTTFGINRDVISYWSQGQSTYDNKTTGLLDFIQNTVQFSAADFANTYQSQFKYKEKNRTIAIKYDHLPFMRHIQEIEMEMVTKKVNTLKTLVDSGATFETAAALVNLEDLKASTKNNSNGGNAE